MTPLFTVVDRRTGHVLTSRTFLGPEAAERWITQQQDEHDRGFRVFSREELLNMRPVFTGNAGAAQ